MDTQKFICIPPVYGIKKDFRIKSVGETSVSPLQNPRENEGRRDYVTKG